MFSACDLRLLAQRLQIAGVTDSVWRRLCLRGTHRSREARHWRDLPAGAVIVGIRVRSDGGWPHAVSYPGESPPPSLGVISNLDC